MKSKEKCSICGQTTKYVCGNLFKLKTSTSTTPLTAVIRRISGGNAYLLDMLQEGFSCQECLLKIEEYDEAYTRAKHLEGHLQYLLDNRLKRQNRTKRRSNLIFHCKKSVSPKRTCRRQSREGHILTPFQQKGKIHPKDERDALETEFQDDQEDAPPPSPISFKESQSEADEDEVDDFVHALSQWNECETCGKAFSTKSKLSLHKQMHKRRAKCEICDKNFKNDILLDIHRQTHDGKSELECVECSKVFSSKGALIKHYRIHRGEYLYQCEHCGKQFIHDSSMRMHKMGHEDSRDKKCSVCDRGFRSTQHLKRHLRTHTGEKPYYCSKCGKKFAQKYNMMTHYSKVHSIAVQKRMFPCSYCSESFAQRFQVSEHIRHIHSGQNENLPAPANQVYNNKSEIVEEYTEFFFQPDYEPAVMPVGS